MVELCRDNMSLHGAGVLLIVAFTFQIYADFSAYTDIARGSAKLLGVKLRRNFQTPYFSRNPSEFWQRWHMSLSSWIRDYVYISLGGNRHGVRRTLFNLLATMSLAGLWHGAGWFFIAWGAYHGLLLCLYQVCPFDRWLERAMGKVGRVMAILWMFALVAFGWAMFYLGEIGSFMKVFDPKNPAIPTVSVGDIAYGILLFAAPLIVTDWLGFRKAREFVDLWPHFSEATKLCLYVLFFYGIVMLGARESHEFIYFRF